MSREKKNLVIFILVAAALVFGGLWATDWLDEGGPTQVYAKPGQIVFVSDRMGESDIWIMDEDGSNPRRLKALNGEERETAFSPEGDWVFATAELGSDQLQLIRMRPNGKAAGKLLSVTGGQSSISISEESGLVGYISNSQVFAATFDGKNPRMQLPSDADKALDIEQLQGMPGEAPPLRRYSNVYFSKRKSWLAALSQGYDNQRGYISLGTDTVTTTLVGADGQPLLAEELYMAWSSDGSKLAVATIGPPGPTSLMIYTPDPEMDRSKLGGEGPTDILLQDKKSEYGLRRPAWSADGKYIAFERIKNLPDGARVQDGIWQISVEGGLPKQLVAGEVGYPNYSPNGKFLLYQKGDDLVRLDLTTMQSLNLTKGKGLNRYASWSPVEAK